MYKDENMASSLAKLFSQFDYVMIDTCSMMEDSFPIMLDALSNARKSGYLGKETVVCVEKKCFVELKKHAKKKKPSRFAKRYEIEAQINRIIAAKRAIKIVRHAKLKRVLSIVKNKNTNFADNVIYSKVSIDRISKAVLVITQDKKLAWDLNGLNFLGSQKGRPLTVMKLLPDGKLIINKGEKPNPQELNRPITNTFQAKPKKQFSFIIEEDKNLKTNLHNPTFPKEKAKAAVLMQLERLKSLDARQISKLKLTYDVNALKALLPKENVSKDIASKAVAPKEEIKKEEKPVKKEETAKPLQKKEIPLENKPHSEGVTVEDAIRKCAAKLGVLIRDPSVPFIKGPHGQFDITNNDVYDLVNELIAKIKVEKKPSVSKKDYVVSCSRIEKGLYYCWIENSKVEIKEEPKPALIEKKPVSKKKKEAEKEEPTAAKPAKKPAKTKTVKAEPEAKVAKEKPSKAKAAKAKPVKEETKSLKTEEVIKAAPKTKAKKASVVVKEGAKAETKKKEKKETPKPSTFEEAVKYDKVLKANITNPTYSKEKKIKSVEDQIKRLKGLSDEEIAKLNFNVDSLKDFLAQNK